MSILQSIKKILKEDIPSPIELDENLPAKVGVDAVDSLKKVLQKFVDDELKGKNEYLRFREAVTIWIKEGKLNDINEDTIDTLLEELTFIVDQKQDHANYLEGILDDLKIK